MLGLVYAARSRRWVLNGDGGAVSCRVGCDLLAVADVQQSIEQFGVRYLRRVYTPRELASCGGAAHRLAARFAAKEAAIKVLRPGDVALPLLSIEIIRKYGGWCEVALFGPAAALARAGGLADLQVSLAHEADYAMAVVHANVY